MSKTKSKVKFVQLSNFEMKFEYKGHTFILLEQSIGFYGAGRSVQLFQLDGFKKTHIVNVGWTKPDSKPSFKDYLIEEITTWEEIRKESIIYLDKFLPNN